MAEKDFQSEVSRGCRSAGGFFYKIPDQPVSQMTRARFTEAKPFDCWWATSSGFVAMELKQKHGLSLNCGDKGDLRRHQEAALLAIAEVGHTALVLCHFLHRFPEKKARQIGVERVDRAFAAPIGAIIGARTELCSDSIPLEWWATNGHELTLCRVDGSRSWDMQQLQSWLEAH